jgi:hypothetical protein
VYRTVRPGAFTGYYVERQGFFDILIAEPEKALIDYIYFKTYRNKKFNLEDERIDKDIVSKLNKKKLDRYSRQYNIDLRGLYAQL